MTDTFTKLSSGITESTIWSEPHSTRSVWVTMLAMADANGDVSASIPGLARRANATMEETEAALRCFLSPDPYSRTKENEGRRIIEIDGGWHLLNHGAYRGQRDPEARRQQNREAQARYRVNHANSENNKPEVSQSKPIVSSVSRDKPKSAQAEAEAEAVKEKYKKEKSRFEEFWDVYPQKTGKKPCHERWVKSKFDQFADLIIADVCRRKSSDQRWRDGYIPNPLTYLNQERWADGDSQTKKTPLNDFLAGAI